MIRRVHSFQIKHPGPTSQARWMAKALYLLKMFILREQYGFGSTRNEFNTVRDVCISIVVLYAKAWYGCENAVTAANRDLLFMKVDIAYAKIDKSLSDASLDKIQNHLWYLSEEVRSLRHGR